MADPADIAHLLRRTEFVARPERVAALSALTRDQAVDDVLNAPLTSLAVPAELAVHDDENSYAQMVIAIAWWVGRMLSASRPIREKMTLFWHGHFCSSWWKVRRTEAMIGQNVLFHALALGNFRDLTQQMALQPAMLRYLDNNQNRKESPNENFSRELMELFTLGVNQYTQGDVAAAARAWTGHSEWINDSTGLDEYVFDASRHDDGQKTFFGSTRNWNGPEVIDEILQANAGTKAVSARFVTRKLWEFFAYQNPPTWLVDELANVFLQNDLDVRAVLGAVLRHPEFYSTTAKRGLVRSPIDFSVAVAYHTAPYGITVDTVAAPWLFDRMGQVPFDPPNVSGWRPNAYWVNTSAMSGRAVAARQVTWPIRATGWGDDLQNPALASDAVVDTVAAMFHLTASNHGRPLSEATRRPFVDFVNASRGWSMPTDLLTMMMLAPEFNLA